MFSAFVAASNAYGFVLSFCTHSIIPGNAQIAVISSTVPAATPIRIKRNRIFWFITILPLLFGRKNTSDLHLPDVHIVRQVIHFLSAGFLIKRLLLCGEARNTTVLLLTRPPDRTTISRFIPYHSGYSRLCLIIPYDVKRLQIADEAAKFEFVRKTHGGANVFQAVVRSQADVIYLTYGR